MLLSHLGRGGMWCITMIPTSAPSLVQTSTDVFRRMIYIPLEHRGWRVLLCKRTKPRVNTMAGPSNTPIPRSKFGNVEEPICFSGACWPIKILDDRTPAAWYLKLSSYRIHDGQSVAISRVHSSLKACRKIMNSSHLGFLRVRHFIIFEKCDFVVGAQQLSSSIGFKPFQPWNLRSARLFVSCVG